VSHASHLSSMETFLPNVVGPQGYTSGFGWVLTPDFSYVVVDSPPQMRADARVFEYSHEPLPFPPGQSPFHIKGQFYIQQMRALKRLERQGFGPVTDMLPADLGARMVRAIAQFYDFAPAAVIPPSDSHILTVERAEVPLCMIEWFSINARGYAESALQIAGVPNIASEHSYAPTGESHGVPVGRVVMTIQRTS
jgi:hypothetical protein